MEVYGEVAEYIGDLHRPLGAFLPASGGIIHFYRFPGRRTVISLIQTFYSVPRWSLAYSFLFYSPAGPLGSMGLLFTPTVMVIGRCSWWRRSCSVSLFSGVASRPDNLGHGAFTRRERDSNRLGHR